MAWELESLKLGYRMYLIKVWDLAHYWWQLEKGLEDSNRI